MAVIRPQRYVASGTIAADGTCEIEFTMGGVFTHQVTFVRARQADGSPVTKVPSALTYLNGEEFEGTRSAQNDRNTSVFTLDTDETYTCIWSNGNPGDRVFITVRGLEERPQ